MDHRKRQPPSPWIKIAAGLLATVTAALADEDLFSRINRSESVSLITMETATLHPGDEPGQPGVTHSLLRFRESLYGDEPNVDMFEAADPGVQTDLLQTETNLIMAVRKKPGSPRRQVLGLWVENETNLNLALHALRFPYGWTWREGVVSSPWPINPAIVFEDADNPRHPFACSRTGRPTFLAPASLSFDVRVVSAKRPVYGLNDRGDGKFVVRVVNTETTPVTVPALRTDGTEVLWAHSLLLFYNQQPYLLAGADRASTNRAVRLEAGEALETTLDLFTAEHFPWPREGDRSMSIRVVLGRHTDVLLFSYLPAYHAKFRTQLAP